MKNMKCALAAALVAGFAGPVSAAPTINLIDIGGVTGTAAEQGFKIAANYWESVLTNNAVLNLRVGYSGLGAGVLANAGSSLVTVPISSYYSALGSTGTSAIDEQAVAHLAPLSGTGSVAVNVPDYANPVAKNGIAVSGSRMAPDGQAISRTIALSTANAKALVGGSETLIDGTIRFSNTFNFDFNPSDGITAGFYDFIGVAVHEMGHSLGFLSGADDFDYFAGSNFSTDNDWWGYGMDMFRYSAPGVLDWTFGTASYFSLDGGVTAYDDGYFSTGSRHGDGSQASHWKKPATSCVDLRGIMNPYLCDGANISVTGLDLALMDTIGWNINVDVAANPQYAFTSAQMYSAYMYSANAVPEPASLLLMLAGLGVMGGVMRQRRRATGAA